MKKIISVFQRNYDGDRLIRDEVVPGAEWVLAGEGEATRKFDGTCCLFRDGKLYKRHEVAKGKKPPPGFEPATDIDPETGKQQGWLLVGDGPEDKWHREALNACLAFLQDGKSYELIGPKIQGNPESVKDHFLVLHGVQKLHNVPRTFEGIRTYLEALDIEGIVFHHPDGRMAKVKKKDFGLKRKPKEVVDGEGSNG